MSENKAAQDVLDTPDLDHPGIEDDIPLPATTDPAPISGNKPIHGGHTEKGEKEEAKDTADGNGAVKKADAKDPEKATESSTMVPFFALFRFASKRESILMILGSICAAANGSALPLFSLVFGNLLNNLNLNSDAIQSAVLSDIKYFVILGCGSFVASWGALGLWMYTAETRTKALREEFLKSTLRQNVSYFDQHKPGEIPSQLTTDSIQYQNGTGEKVATFIQHNVTFFAGIIIGLVKGWQLGLVVLGVTPLMGIAIGGLTAAFGGVAKKGQQAYTAAGGVADESISLVRTVVSFNAQKREFDRYLGYLKNGELAGIKNASSNGLALGMINLIMFSSYGLCLWFGAYLIREQITNPSTGKAYSGGDVVTVFFAIIIGAMSLGQAGPSVQAFALARVAAYSMFKVIDTKSEIDSMAETGKKLDNLQGTIQLQAVNFAYPTRPDVELFKNFNITIQAGQNVALVGASGSGKSSVIALIERFYDPQQGKVLIDGEDLRDLNLKWWREQAGLVSQEPVLFAGTVKENIIYGRKGITDEQVVEAAKAANAHEFITRLDKGYYSIVGEDGSLLSGGQKQRIAIARAMLKNPRVLLLDEATSALDNESERAVQQALNNIMVGRTTITIAHRLSTIVNSDVIFVIQDGKICERGTHAELLAKDGVYTNLIRAQQAKVETDEKKQALVASPEVISQQKEVVVEITPSPSGNDLDKASSSQVITKDSTTSFADAKEKQKKSIPSVSNFRVFELAKENWPFMIVGVISASAAGCAMPLWSLIFGNMMAVLYAPADIQESESRTYALYFFALGVGLFLAESLKGLSFGVVGERLTQKLRCMCFQTIFRQEMGWFDEEENNPRVLTTRLASDTSAVHGGTTQRLGTVVQIIATLITGLLIAFVLDWSLALVVMSLGPVMVIASVFQMRFVLGFQAEGKIAFEKAGQIAGEAVANIRTVASFAAEDSVMSRFSNSLQSSVKVGVKVANTSGIAFGFSQLTIFLAYALYFWYGAKLVAEGDLSFGSMMKVIFAIVIAAMGIGQAMQMAPDLTKALIGRDNVFFLLDRKSKIDPESNAGDDVKFTDGAIEFNDVYFEYPTRPQVPVLRHFNLKVKPGQTVALVGASGCGKSTIISLLLRFYDPRKGTITIDGHELTKVNLKTLHAQISVVSQEPKLFDTSIAENIRYGKADATMEEIMNAAKQANIHDSIMELPQGYDTLAGARGTQLSGGQKQRIAIARALIRNPRILLLDEATSALDSQSEKVVQEALEKIMADRNRTIIVVAHRLSTIKNADAIAVLSKGAVVETGTHAELLAKNGVYAALYRSREQQ